MRFTRRSRQNDPHAAVHGFFAWMEPVVIADPFFLSVDKTGKHYIVNLTDENGVRRRHETDFGALGRSYCMCIGAGCPGGGNGRKRRGGRAGNVPAGIRRAESKRAGGTGGGVSVPGALHITAPRPPSPRIPPRPPASPAPAPPTSCGWSRATPAMT